jgi:hypothetical protein
MAGIDLEIVSGNEFMSRHVATRTDLEPLFGDLARHAIAIEYESLEVLPVRQMHQVVVAPSAEGFRAGLDFCITPSVTLADGSAMLLPESSVTLIDDMRSVNAVMHVATKSCTGLVEMSARNTLISRVLALKLHDSGIDRVA